MSKFRECCVENAWARVVLMRQYKFEVGDGSYGDLQFNDYFQQLYEEAQARHPATPAEQIQRDMCMAAWEYAEHGCGVRG